jgi:hypothetical protein
MRVLTVLLLAGVAVALGATSRAGRGVEAAEGEIPFDDVRIFFEFNSTDNDLGVQVLLDGEGWNRLEIDDPRGVRILDITAGGSLGELGLTELFFESSEPSPEEVLGLFRAGKYEFEGETVEGEELEGEARLSHKLPPAPVILVPAVPGEELDRTNAVIEWQAIPGIAGFEVIVENEDVGAEMTVPLSASTTRLHVPEEFLDPDTGYKVEVLAIGENGNKTISEREFVTGP